MMRYMTIILFFLTLSIIIIGCSEDEKSSRPTAPPTLEQQLAALPGATVTEISPPNGFNRAFEINLPQPVDHANPSGQKFSQRIFISHRSETAPTVLLISGYAVNSNRVLPIAELLDANQIYMDHRYFGDAAPDPIVWEYLNIFQAASDCHRVVNLLSPIYKGPWVSHGVSKGGGATLFHRRFFPDDVVATVAQVAPINLDTIDARYDNFLLNEVGDAACRERILNFQRLVLSRRNELLPMYQAYATQKQLSFRLGLEAVFEINTLEFLFFYWQYGPHDCNAIPDSTATSQEIFDYLQTMGGIDWLQDEVQDQYVPAYYQFYTEFGYYRLIEDHVSDLLESPYQLSYSLFCPQGVARAYDPTVTQDVLHWLQTEGNNILYIYGEVDPITACGVELTGQTNALKIILPGESHWAGYNGFGPFTSQVYDSLESWVGVNTNDSVTVALISREEAIRITRGL